MNIIYMMSFLSLKFINYRDIDLTLINSDNLIQLSSQFTLIILIANLEVFFPLQFWLEMPLSDEAYG